MKSDLRTLFTDCHSLFEDLIRQTPEHQRLIDEQPGLMPVLLIARPVD